MTGMARGLAGLLTVLCLAAACGNPAGGPVGQPDASIAAQPSGNKDQAPVGAALIEAGWRPVDTRSIESTMAVVALTLTGQSQPTAVELSDAHAALRAWPPFRDAYAATTLRWWTHAQGGGLILYTGVDSAAQDPAIDAKVAVLRVVVDQERAAYACLVGVRAADVISVAEDLRTAIGDGRPDGQPFTRQSRYGRAEVRLSISGLT